jgi:hypothetical protein
MTITVTQSCLDNPAEIDKEEGALKDRDFSYDRFIRPTEGQMTRVVWRIVRDPEDAEDALQDALSTIWKKRRLVCTHPNPLALILKICINAAPGNMLCYYSLRSDIGSTQCHCRAAGKQKNR